MKSSEVALAATVAVVLFAVVATQGVYTTTTELNLNPKLNVKKTCQTEDKKEGICVPYRFCRSNYTINVYGTIDENELREGNCAGFFDWCCYIEERASYKEVPGCSSAGPTDCPWCASLYRDGGNPRTRSESGLFCAGALVGDGLVLTTASCVAAARNQHVWVQLASNPNKNYSVTIMKRHPQFDSGRRVNDLAVMVLSERVGLEKGACFQLSEPRGGNCRSFGYDANDNVIMTPVKITRKRCDASIDDVDSDFDSEDDNGEACATPVSDNGDCHIALGAPVICPLQEQFGLWGIARTSCRPGSSHVGALHPTASWLKTLLVLQPNASDSNNEPLT